MRIISVIIAKKLGQQVVFILNTINVLKNLHTQRAQKTYLRFVLNIIIKTLNTKTLSLLWKYVHMSRIIWKVGIVLRRGRQFHEHRIHWGGHGITYFFKSPGVGTVYSLLINARIGKVCEGSSPNTPWKGRPFNSTPSDIQWTLSKRWLLLKLFK